MGNTQKKINQQLNLANSLVSNPRFKELTGLNLSFALLLRNPVKILGKIVNNKEDFQIQINFISKDDSTPSEIGILSPENFQKISNIIQHLLSFTVTADVNEDSLCSICLENPADTILECGHQFCLSDLQSWELKNKECPLCRGTFAVSKSFVRLEGFSGDIKEEVKICKEEIFRLISYSN